MKLEDSSVEVSQAELGLLDGLTATTAELNTVADLSSQQETIAAAGAVSVTKRLSNLALSGAGAVTLAAPNAAMDGMIKIISMTVDNGDVTMALTQVVGGTAATTATFDAVGETLVLVASAALSKWIVLKEHGVTLA